jgi:hypothetical protein
MGSIEAASVMPQASVETIILEYLFACFLRKDEVCILYYLTLPYLVHFSAGEGGYGYGTRTTSPK